MALPIFQSAGRPPTLSGKCFKERKNMMPLRRNLFRGNRNAFRFFRKTSIRFLRIRGTPRALALGTALGVFVGMSPLLGFHTLIAVCAAALFKANKITAAVGVWISNPFTVALIYPLTYRVGGVLFGDPGGKISSLFSNEGGAIALFSRAPRLFWRMTAGGFFLGVPLSICVYCVSRVLVERYRKRRDEKKKLRKKIGKTFSRQAGWRASRVSRTGFGRNPGKYVDDTGN
jgi:hypothetical protein